MESDRESILKKGYMKIFALSLLLLITGIIIMSVANILYTFAEPKTSGESIALVRWMNTLITIRALCVQLGMVLFSLSILMGALVDKTLSGEVRRGMVLASGFGILALGIMMITVIVF